MKKIYEYAIVNKKDNKILDKAFTRLVARGYKNEWKAVGVDAKIVQRKFEMVEQKEVR